MKGKAKAKEFEGEGYPIHVIGKNVMVTEPMKNYAMEKLSKIEKFTKARLIDATISMDVQKHEQRADIILKVDHTILNSHAASNDMYVSIDQAVDKIETQLRRYKTKIRDHQAKDLATIDLKVNILQFPAEQEVFDVNLDIEEQNRNDLMKVYRPHKIVSEETTPLKLLTYDEAVAKMEKSKDAFMLFKNEEDLMVSLIYRRKDGNYGVIEVQSESAVFE